jgi:hypothetical protein
MLVVYQCREILHYINDVTKQDLMEAWSLSFDATFASNMAQLACEWEWECVPQGGGGMWKVYQHSPFFFQAIEVPPPPLPPPTK